MCFLARRRPAQQHHVVVVVVVVVAGGGLLFFSRNEGKSWIVWYYHVDHGGVDCQQYPQNNILGIGIME
jgi:hypothetical protein